MKFKQKLALFSTALLGTTGVLSSVLVPPLTLKQTVSHQSHQNSILTNHSHQVFSWSDLPNPSITPVADRVYMEFTYYVEPTTGLYVAKAVANDNITDGIVPETDPNGRIIEAIDPIRNFPNLERFKLNSHIKNFFYKTSLSSFFRGCVKLNSLYLGKSYQGEIKQSTKVLDKDLHLNGSVMVGIDPENPYLEMHGDYSLYGGGYITYKGKDVDTTPALYAWNKVNLSSSLTKIVDNAFFNTLITGVNIPASVKQVGINAFSFSSLKTVNFINDPVNYPGGVYINQGAFNSCSIAQLFLPDNLAYLGSNAFLNNQLSYVVLPNTVFNIGGSVFDSKTANKSGIKGLILTYTPEQLDQITDRNLIRQLFDNTYYEGDTPIKLMYLSAPDDKETIKAKYQAKLDLSDFSDFDAYLNNFLRWNEMTPIFDNANLLRDVNFYQTDLGSNTDTFSVPYVWKALVNDFHINNGQIEITINLNQEVRDKFQMVNPSTEELTTSLTLPINPHQQSFSFGLSRTSSSAWSDTSSQYTFSLKGLDQIYNNYFSSSAVHTIQNLAPGSINGLTKLNNITFNPTVDDNHHLSINWRYSATSRNTSMINFFQPDALGLYFKILSGSWDEWFITYPQPFINIQKTNYQQLQPIYGEYDNPYNVLLTLPLMIKNYNYDFNITKDLTYKLVIANQQQWIFDTSSNNDLKVDITSNQVALQASEADFNVNFNYFEYLQTRQDKNFMHKHYAWKDKASVNCINNALLVANTNTPSPITPLTWQNLTLEPDYSMGSLQKQVVLKNIQIDPVNGIDFDVQYLYEDNVEHTYDIPLKLVIAQNISTPTPALLSLSALPSLHIHTTPNTNPNQHGSIKLINQYIEGGLNNNLAYDKDSYLSTITIPKYWNIIDNDITKIPDLITPSYVDEQNQEHLLYLRLVNYSPYFDTADYGIVASPTDYDTSLLLRVQPLDISQETNETTYKISVIKNTTTDLTELFPEIHTFPKVANNLLKLTYHSGFSQSISINPLTYNNDLARGIDFSIDSFVDTVSSRPIIYTYFSRNITINDGFTRHYLINPVFSNLSLLQHGKVLTPDQLSALHITLDTENNRITFAPNTLYDLDNLQIQLNFTDDVNISPLNALSNFFSVHINPVVYHQINVVGVDWPNLDKEISNQAITTNDLTNHVQVSTDGTSWKDVGADTYSVALYQDNQLITDYEALNLAFDPQTGVITFKANTEYHLSRLQLRLTYHQNNQPLVWYSNLFDVNLHPSLPPSPTPSQDNNLIPIILGSVFGGIALIGLLTALIVYAKARGLKIKDKKLLTNKWNQKPPKKVQK